MAEVEMDPDLMRLIGVEGGEFEDLGEMRSAEVFGPAGTVIPAGGDPEAEVDGADVLVAEMLDAMQAGDGAFVDEEEALEFDANLAEFMDRGALDRLASNVCRWVDADKQSRRAWEIREAEGIVALGLSDAQVRELREQGPRGAWGASATHPGLVEALIQFWARAFGELWQAGQPAKTIVLGATDPAREAQAERVRGYLNYLYCEEMPSAEDELSAMLWRLPLSGSVFRKAYYDPIERTIAVEFVEGQDLVKPYSARDLRKAPRFTHLVRMVRNDLDRLIDDGYYLNVLRNDPVSESADAGVLDRVIDDATGQAPGIDAGEADAEFDQRDLLYECAAVLNLDDYGFEDAYGESWGLPYLVTVHKAEQKVLAIRRNWRPSDARKRRRLFVVEYKFLPGLGGYGFGLLHIAKGTADAQTGFLRYLLDAGAMDTVGRFSGWCSQDMVGAGEMPPLEMGKFKKVPGTADEWKKRIMTAAEGYRWNGQGVLPILEYLDTKMATLVASTEALIGEDVKNVPVGTMLARVEQGLKPFVTIFTLLHAAFRRELRAVAELAADYMPERYPYAVDGADQEVMAADFDDRVDVVPASDPNVVTALQRVLQGQAVIEMVKGDPEVFGAPQRLQAYQHYLGVLRIPQFERFLPSPADPNQPPAPQSPDPMAAKVSREDAVAAAKISREDALAQAKIAREAERMRVDAERRRAGDRAIQAAEAQAEMDDTQREILQEAQARRRNLAEQAQVPEVV